jgi:hypothetical protein
MKTLKIEPKFNITDAVNEGVQLATLKNVVVEFDFNEIQCLVSKTTKPDLLVRDYMHAHLMQWKTIGPDPVEKYSDEVQADFDSRKKAQEEKQEQQRQEWEKKDQEEKQRFELKTKGINIDLIDTVKWQSWKDANSDGYGAAAMEFAESWAKLMQLEIANGKKLIECAKDTSYELGFLGISGFQYGCAVQVLSAAWKHGEDLRVWHNGEYNHKGDGVVNPAILTVN